MTEEHTLTVADPPRTHRLRDFLAGWGLALLIGVVVVIGLLELNSIRTVVRTQNQNHNYSAQDFAAICHKLQVHCPNNVVVIVNP